jgi:hypothetical protein
MIRCPWCGTQNYAIDSWCSSCSRHLDWAPPSRAAAVGPKPTPVPRPASPETRHRRRRVLLLVPAAAALAVAIALALPVASWFNTVGRTPPALPNTALGPVAPAAPSAKPDVTPSPGVTSSPDPTPTADENPPQVFGPPAEPAPTAEAPNAALNQPGEAVPATGSDPTATVARFYRDVSSHDFAAAAALWSPRMQAQYPPAVYIGHRFAGTQLIDLRNTRTVAEGGGSALVYVNVVEVIDGQSRQWVGTWQLVRTALGWLLDQPNLRAAR